MLSNTFVMSSLRILSNAFSRSIKHMWNSLFFAKFLLDYLRVNIKPCVLLASMATSGFLYRIFDSIPYLFLNYSYTIFSEYKWGVWFYVLFIWCLRGLYYFIYNFCKLCYFLISHVFYHLCQFRVLLKATYSFFQRFMTPSVRNNRSSVSVCL